MNIYAPPSTVKANTELKDSKPILFRGQFDAKDFANTVVSLALRDNITDAPELAFGDDDDDEDDYGNNDEHVADENAGPSADSLSSRIAQSVTNASAELDI